MGTARPRKNQTPTITKGPTMTHEWTQPRYRLEYRYRKQDGSRSEWLPVLFIRPLDRGYEVMGLSGTVWSDVDVETRPVG